MLSPANRGKTFLSYAIACYFIECAKEDWLVNYASASELRYAEDITDVESRLKDTRWKSLYIIDDCHQLPNDADRFLRWVLRNRQGSCYFLFVMRGFSKDELDTAFSLLSKEDGVFPLIPDIPHVKAIIRAYIECIKHKYPTSVHLNPSDDELEQFIQEKVGTNLDRLMRFLTEAWDPDHQDLREASEDRILNSTWRYYRLDDVERRQLLSVLAALGQFDIGVHASFLESRSSAHRIQELMSESHLKVRRKPGLPRFFTLVDAKDSEYVLKTIAIDRRVDPRQYSVELIKEYLRTRPPNTIWVFHMSWRDKQKQIIKRVFEDNQAMTALQESLVGRSFNTQEYVATKLEIIDPQLTYDLLSHPVLKQQTQKARGAPAYRIRHLLTVLHGQNLNAHFLILGRRQII